MDRTSPINVGVCGMGGFGGSVIESLKADAASDRPYAHLSAVCSNDFHRHPELCAALRAEGVKLIEDVDAFLAEPTEAVWLPLPIPLHRPMTEKALAAGKVVMCEKPAAGCVEDVDAMIAARDRAGLPAVVGFGDLYDPTTVPLKRDLLAGRIGKIQSVSMFGCWPRGDTYYKRTDWAGAFKRNGVWVMDSPAQNAMSHYINIALFLLGPAAETSAEPVEVEAELYRVNPIENYDTISMRLTLAGGVKMLVLLTHACQTNVGPDIVIRGDRGTVVRTSTAIQIDSDGATTSIPRTADTRLMSIRKLAALTRKQADPEIGVATLEVARAQVLAINGASEASAVKTLDDSVYQNIPRPPQGTVRSIPGIESVFEACRRDGKMLHESGLVKWSVPAGRKDLRGYRRFAGPKDLAGGPR